VKRTRNSFRPALELLENRLVPTGPTAPAYSSLPGAKATLYLDFSGDFESQWGSNKNITTPAFDTDGDPTTFSASELTAIHDIWAYVSEDYAPFNINVTTVDPGIDYTSAAADGVALKVVIGGDGSWYGGGGGVSFVGAFSDPNLPNVSFVFSVGLQNVPRYVADACSHEAGHEFGLNHQSQYTGSTLTYEYSYGPGDDTAPIMGASYYSTRSLWWYGTSDVSSTTYQNDMDVIASAANGFGYRPQAIGNSVATATPLTVDGTGAVSASGVIEHMTDLNYYSFTTGSGTITLNVNVPTPYNNLDARMELLDASGNLVASDDPSTSYSASITYTATAGTYYLVVASHGPSANAISTNYGFDVGQYTVSGTVVPANSTAPAAPTNLSASAGSSSAINLTWSDNSSNENGFQVERLVNGTWTQVAVVGANVTSWQDTGLAAGTSYSYRVRAYNAAGESAYSNTASATTSPAATTPSAPANLAASVKTKPHLGVFLTWTDTSTNETGFLVQRSADGGVTWVQLAQLAANSTSYTDGGVSSGAAYQYRVCAYNAAGSSGYSNVVTITVGGATRKQAPAAALPLGGTDLPGGPLGDILGWSWLDSTSGSTGTPAGIADRLSNLSPAGNDQDGQASGQAGANAVLDFARIGGLSPVTNSDLTGLPSGRRRGVWSVPPHANGSILDAPDFNPLTVQVGLPVLVG
jgi:hypothetical protein